MDKELIKNLDTSDHSRHNAERALQILQDHHEVNITHKQGKDSSVCFVEEEIGNWPWIDRSVFVRGTWFDIEHSMTEEGKPVFYITANQERVYQVYGGHDDAKIALRDIYKLNSEQNLPNITAVACLHEGEYYKSEDAKEILSGFRSTYSQAAEFIKKIDSLL